MSTLTYTRYSDSIETPTEDEELKTRKICALINDNQRRNFHLHRHAFRGTHLKSQALVKGSLTVLSDLPDHLAQGMFAVPATYDIALRYASEPFKILDDTVNAPRGIGLRVFDVAGEKLSSANDTKTHDWTFNNAPVLELRNVDTYLELETLRSKYWDSPALLQAALMTRSDALLQLAPGQLPNENIVSHEMHTQSAFRYGDYIAKLALVPGSESQAALSSAKIGKDDPDYRLSEMLEAHFAETETTYNVMVQLMVDPERQPVEDAGVEWNRKETPFQHVARITIPKQAAFSDARRVFWEDKMSLDPWAGLAAHRPLGSINRCRKMAYEMSRQYRTRKNAQDVVQVTDIDQIPA